MLPSSVVNDIKRTLDQLNVAEVDGRMLKLAFTGQLGDLCRSAWDGGGRGLLEGFLERRVLSAADARVRLEVMKGLVRLAEANDIPASSMAARAKDFKAELAAEDKAELDAGRLATGQTATVEDVLNAQANFISLAEQALTKARFARVDRRADLAVFEAFRFTLLASHLDDGLTPEELAALHGVAQRFDPSAKCEDTFGLLEKAVEGLGPGVARLEGRSLTLRLTRSNVLIREGLAVAAVEIIRRTIALGGVESAELAAFDTDGVFERLEPAADAYDSELIVRPRARSGLRADLVLDELYGLYTEHVPWRDGRAE